MDQEGLGLLAAETRFWRSKAGITKETK